MFNKFEIFQVPVYQSRYTEANELEKNIIPIFLDKEKNNKQVVYYPTGSYTSFGQDSILNLAELLDLKNFIFDTVTEINKDAGLGGELEFTNSWFSINRKHSYHESHTHVPDIWSGVYYVSATPGDAPISFINKNLKETMWPYRAPKVTSTNLNSSQVICSVETGLLIIFPSYLTHQVSQQLLDSERITIAFNLNIKYEHSKV